jgi:superfamily II DNA or RNA helicase
MPNAQHPKAAAFVRQHLFSGLTAFEELEARIAGLPDAQSRGDAFEVFAEAYLATQRKHDAATVWPLASASSQTLQRLGLATQDYGIDGVFQTLLGHLNVYQVKFRTNRPALTWRELSTFMGLADSPNIHSRILFTNCDELPSVINERQGFFCIRGSDLDRLESEDFCAIEAWLADSAFTAPRKQPLPHQVEALEALLPALETNDRVSAIMACGTGKTLIALWVAERRQASLILVLVPSLALLRQILHEWLRETSLPNLAYLCVCSDSTVKDGLDSLATAQSDLDFQVSTNADNVRDFFDAPFIGTKVVFATYQSAQVVGAALEPGEAFDLAIFDEAHKTAGREGRNYAFALEDVNLPIRKRLFMTATPRHYNPRQQDREGEAKLVFSMDRSDVYGPQAYRLTFAEAARRGIICGYKVIISVISSDMVTNEILSRGEVLVNGDAVHARQVANQIALRDAIEKYGVNKVFTFHKTVKSAESFVADGNEGVGAHLKEFETFHVNGTMPTARREREMRDFRAATRAIISNARCLTEGVDVPAVDMVAFLSPRRSRVDIVQATGRAMRRSPGKTTGYVLVPLYVEQAADESVEAAVSRSSFDEVWDVLHSLQEQDEVLAELIRHMGVQKGRGKRFDDGRFADRVDITGISLGLEALRSAVTTRCFESLFSSWDTYFGKLVAFKKQFGHCNIKTGWKKDPALAGWASAQRARRSKGLLNSERIRLLDDIGFVWDWQRQSANANWVRWFEKLKSFKERYGHCNVEIDRWENRRLSGCTLTQLVGWTRMQRVFFSKGKLTQEQILQLETIGFIWNKADENWMKRFNELVQYKEEHGDCRVPRKWEENPCLGSWASTQRQLKRKDKLDAEYERMLNEIGFVWTNAISDAFKSCKTEKVWMKRVNELIQYKEEHGDCRVPTRWEENPCLGSWASTQRQLKRKCKLDAKRERMLNEIGFVWEYPAPTASIYVQFEDAWMKRFNELVQYKEEYGDCRVPTGWESNPSLGSWVSAQRQRQRNGKLNAKRERMLNEVGFMWANS